MYELYVCNVITVYTYIHSGITMYIRNAITMYISDVIFNGKVRFYHNLRSVTCFCVDLLLILVAELCSLWHSASIYDSLSSCECSVLDTGG